MYKNGILDTLTGNQPDLEKLIKEQANKESEEPVRSSDVSHKRGSDLRPKQFVKGYNSVKRHK